MNLHRHMADMLSVAATTYREQKAAGIAPSGLSEIWGPVVHAFRTLALAIEWRNWKFIVELAS